MVAEDQTGTGDESSGAKILSFTRKSLKHKEPEAEPSAPCTIPDYIDYLETPGSDSGITPDDARRLREIFLRGPLTALTPEVSAEVIHTVRLEMRASEEGAPSILARHERQLWQAYAKNGKASIIPQFDALTVYDSLLEEAKVAYLPGAEPSGQKPLRIVPKKNELVERFFWLILRMYRYQYEVSQGYAEHNPEGMYLPASVRVALGIPLKKESPPEIKMIPPVKSLSEYFEQRMATLELTKEEVLRIRMALAPLELEFGMIAGKAVYRVQEELQRGKTRNELRSAEIAAWNENPECIPGFDVRRVYMDAFADKDLPWADATLHSVNVLAGGCDIRQSEAESYFWLVLRIYRYHSKLSRPAAPALPQPPPKPAQSAPPDFGAMVPAERALTPRATLIPPPPPVKIEVRKLSWWSSLLLAIRRLF